MLFQVAAKVSNSNEDGSWILGNVLEYDSKTKTYEIQDEDDVNRIMSLPYTDVRRLEDLSNNLRKGDRILAVFPETTSFYKAIVAKNPKPPSSGNGSVGVNNWDVVIKFEDDEDDTGKNPARRVPARFILLRSEVEEIEDSDDEEDK